ncbi:MAG: helix-turn-helix domain-containing protein [Chitinispirillales bacterium]|jgi:transcriptional regulator with XRE-family HTH domain|nr:helix-turn-helix domain-containing protein [Chitinispirillales bacterium]
MREFKFFERFQHILKIRGKSQIEISQDTGIVKSSINHWYLGKAEPRADSLHKLAVTLNVSEAWLMGYDVPMERGDEKQIAQETAFFEQLRYRYGDCGVKLLEIFESLNELGQKETVKRAYELARLPEYT